ncbi:linker for activation of T-cells family member 2 isoform X2 [Phocoena sinus]|uniref:linker for activation of T-cells family member 2 isoform X2 n=1 Tax=Phocoena sinus TaxID=42100 RepID=UPI0013C43DD6|nr:linker for activation of T-cells family member 2 isoform X2 [Phocoena sinus]
MSRGACKRISRTLQWPGPTPWSGRPGQGPWWTRPPTRHQQGRTSCCSSPPASRILHPPGTRTSAKEVDADQMHPTYTPSPRTISIVGSSRSPRKMKMIPIPMRTCSSVGQRKPNQGTRSLRVIRTQHPSGSGGSPGESWDTPLANPREDGTDTPSSGAFPAGGAVAGTGLGTCV